MDVSTYRHAYTLHISTSPHTCTRTHAHTHTYTVDYSKPIDLTDLSNKVRMGNNAATVLKTELPMMKATPVSYLMYGPFGSFAPAYDSAFASLSKTDSELLLSTYGNELGVSYAHSLQQFVKGTGSFVTEMADAVLNGLTNNRHSKFIEKMKQASSKNTSASQDKESKASPKETEAKPKAESTEKTPEAPSTDVTEAPSPSSDEAVKDGPPVADGEDTNTTLQGTEIPTDSPTSFPIVEDTQTPPESSVTEDRSSFPMDTDSRPSFSVDDMVTETSSPFPQDEESRSSFPDSRFESHATSPLSMANSDSGVPSVQGGESSSSSRENPDESEGSSEGGSSRSSSVSERDDQDEDSRDSHVSGHVIVM